MRFAHGFAGIADVPDNQLNLFAFNRTLVMAKQYSFAACRIQKPKTSPV